MEHSSISLNELEKIIILVEAYKKPTLVRIEKIDSKHISKSLDFGASGIIAPNVNTERDMNLIINSTLYPPFGNRGLVCQEQMIMDRNLKITTKSLIIQLLLFR